MFLLLSIIVATGEFYNLQLLDENESLFCKYQGFHVARVEDKPTIMYLIISTMFFDGEGVVRERGF